MAKQIIEEEVRKSERDRIIDIIRKLAFLSPGNRTRIIEVIESETREVK